MSSLASRSNRVDLTAVAGIGDDQKVTVCEAQWMLLLVAAPYACRQGAIRHALLSPVPSPFLQEVVLSAEQDDFQKIMYDNFGDVGVAIE